MQGGGRYTPLRNWTAKPATGCQAGAIVNSRCAAWRPRQGTRRATRRQSCKAFREHSAGGGRSQTEQGAHGCGPPDMCTSRFFCRWLLFLWLRSV
eukprot:gene18563-biopygen17418